MAEYTTVKDVLAAYDKGERLFADVDIENADFRDRDLSNATFDQVTLRGARFDRAVLRHVRCSDADLAGASLVGADLYLARLEFAQLRGARLVGAQIEDTFVEFCDFAQADLTDCDLDGSVLFQTGFSGATLDRAVVGSTTFADVDLSEFCDATEMQYTSPSYVDFRSVLRSYHHPGLKRFLVDCGVPPLVADYTIAAAEAEGDALDTLMRSTFISYGAPDEAFARRLYEELRAHGVTTFFFPENARLGRRIGDEVHSRIQEHDRVILVCSRDSLNRLGVRNEIQETFDREARDGGATYLLPIMLDDYVLKEWQDRLAGRVRDRVVGDFRGAMDDATVFDRAMSRLLAALRRQPT